MKKNIFSILVLIVVVTTAAFLLGQTLNSNHKNSDLDHNYGEYVAKGPLYPKFVQVRPIEINNFNYKDFVVETLGYSEIRVYAQLFKDDYETNPLKSDGLLKIYFSHEMSGLGVVYKSNVYKKEYTSYLDGWATEKIFGRKTKIAVDADNIPRGRYTLQISYYLLP